MENCQSTPRCFLLVAFAQALTWGLYCFDCGESMTVQALSGHRAQFILSDVQPTTMFGRVPYFKAIK